MKDISDIEKSVLSVLEDILNIKSDEIHIKQPFRDLGIDSFSFIQFIVKCETLFDIQFEEDMLLITNFTNASVFIKYIENCGLEQLDKT